jgi:hypothetical protein
LSGDLDTLE